MVVQVEMCLPGRSHPRTAAAGLGVLLRRLVGTVCPEIRLRAAKAAAAAVARTRTQSRLGKVETEEFLAAVAEAAALVLLAVPLQPP